MTNIIPPSPLQSVPRDQNSLRKGFSDLTQAINNKFNTTDTHLGTIDTHLALTQSTLYPAQTYLGISIPAGPNVPVRVAVSSGICEAWPDGTLKQWFSVTATTSTSNYNGFYYLLNQLFNFPISFANSNIISDVSVQFGISIGSVFQSAGPTSTNISIGLMSSDVTSYVVNITSVGRWR